MCLDFSVFPCNSIMALDDPSIDDKPIVHL